MLRRKWNKEKVIEEFYKFKEINIDLKPSHLRKVDPQLYTAIRSYFKSYENFLNVINLDYYEICNKTKLEKKIIKGEYLDVKKCTLCSELKPLNEFSNDKKGVGGKKSWCNFCMNEERRRRLGRKKRRLRRSDEELREEIISIYKEFGDLSYKFMRESGNYSLLTIASERYGGWREALIHFGFNYDGEICSRERWDKVKITKRIKEINIEHLNVSHMLDNHRNLYFRALKYFQTWENALVESGFDYEDIRMDHTVNSRLGFKFESLVSDILKDVHKNKTIKEKGYQYNIRPDFILKNGLWYDAKLSEWTIHRCQTIEKYEPHCKSLVIIYMRGNPHRDEMITNKTRLISVHKFIKQLPRYRQVFYLQEIKKIEDQLKDTYQKQLVNHK
jgi:hypothetical protein